MPNHIVRYCAHCGDGFTVTAGTHQKYCCRACYAAASKAAKQSGGNTPAKSYDTICKNNDYVRCNTGDDCKKCGWDPDVSRARRDAMGMYKVDAFVMGVHNE